jgi:hypothetical protein
VRTISLIHMETELFVKRSELNFHKRCVMRALIKKYNCPNGRYILHNNIELCNDLVCPYVLLIV